MITAMQDDTNDDDGQSNIVQGSLVDKPNEPKKAHKSTSQK